MRSLVLLSLCLLVPQVQGEETGAWGEVDHGLQLGMALTDVSGQRSVRVVLRNVSNQEQHVFVGSDSGSGLMSDIEFLAVESSGKVCRCAERHPFKPGTGVVLPIIVAIPSSSEERWVYPLTEVFSYNCLSGYSLADFVRKHATLKLRFEVTARRAEAASPSQLRQPKSSVHQALWIGKILSGETRP